MNECRTASTIEIPSVKVEAVADLPTKFGHFRVYVFSNDQDHAEHVALVKGDLWGASKVPLRVHSECLTGDVFGSARCDCGEQLERALELIGNAERGVLLYLRQEGRGIGLVNKIRAYSLQTSRGLDTIDANRALGFRDDERDYAVGVAMLQTLGVRSVKLMTNNPDKLRQLTQHGVLVDARVAHAVQPGEHNRAYLETKARRAGHLLEPEPEIG